jgi:hypothetical protein
MLISLEHLNEAHVNGAIQEKQAGHKNARVPGGEADADRPLDVLKRS